jgi:hypothetical protein
VAAVGENLDEDTRPKIYESASPICYSFASGSIHLNMTDLAEHYVEEARRQFRGYKRLGEGALAQLKDEELFVALDPESNSAAIIVKHIAGNMRSRFTDLLTADGEKPDRHRDQEFELSSEVNRADVMRWWESGWSCVFSAIEALRPEDVQRTVTIRGEPHTVLQAINRQLAHYAYHVGQIVFLAKHLRSQDWKSLSIPRGQSEEVNRKLAERKPGTSGSRT